MGQGRTLAAKCPQWMVLSGAGSLVADWPVGSFNEIMDQESHNPLWDWTPVQLAELMRLSRDDWSALEIAMRVGRIEDSVQVKARQLGLSLALEGRKGRRS